MYRRVIVPHFHYDTTLISKMFRFALFILLSGSCSCSLGSGKSSKRLAAVEAELTALRTTTTGLLQMIEELKITVQSKSTQNELLKDQIAEFIITKNGQLEAQLRIVVEEQASKSEQLEETLREEIAQMEENLAERIENQEEENKEMEEYMKESVEEQSTKNQELEHYLFLKNTVEGLRTELARYKGLDNSTAVVTGRAGGTRRAKKLDALLNGSLRYEEKEDRE